MVQRAGLAIDVGAGAAIFADYPAQNAVVLVIQLMLCQPGAGLGNVRYVEGGCDIGALGAMTNRAGICAPPMASPRASSTMDLPAPVSPVSAVIPLLNWSSTRSAMA